MSLVRCNSTTTITTKLCCQIRLHRNFIAARVKWVRDPYLDKAVSKEKNLKQAISLKNQIISTTTASPSKSLPLSSLSSLKPHLFNLPTTPQKFFQKYPTLFTQFQPFPSSQLHIKLTPHALSLHKEEQAIHDSLPHRKDTTKRLAKLLMLTRVGKLPLHVIDRLKLDLGLPHNYITALLSDYPDYFHVCEETDWLLKKDVLCLELVSWRDDLAVSEMERRAANGEARSVKKGERIAFPMSFPKGFDLVKKVKEWVFEWQGLPYISPYENGFHLNMNGDQAEKWIVAVLHELLWLLVSKKTEKENLLVLGEYLGFGDRFKKVLTHHPGIFYVSNKIRTQTVVLREAYRKDLLVFKHPLMGMRFRYIYLMNKDKEKRKWIDGHISHLRSKRHLPLSNNKVGETKFKNKRGEGGEGRSNGSLGPEFDAEDSSDSEFEDEDFSDSEFEDEANDGAMKMER